MTRPVAAEEAGSGVPACCAGRGGAPAAVGERWMCRRRGTRGGRCQLAPAPRACWGSLYCGETARCRLAPCQPPPATATTAAAKCLSSSFPESRGLRMVTQLRAWQLVARAHGARDTWWGSNARVSGLGCGEPAGCAPPAPPSWSPGFPGSCPGCADPQPGLGRVLGSVERAGPRLRPSRPQALLWACWGDLGCARPVMLARNLP